MSYKEIVYVGRNKGKTCYKIENLSFLRLIQDTVKDSESRSISHIGIAILLEALKSISEEYPERFLDVISSIKACFEAIFHDNTHPVHWDTNEYYTQVLNLKDLPSRDYKISGVIHFSIIGEVSASDFCLIPIEGLDVRSEEKYAKAISTKI